LAGASVQTARKTNSREHYQKSQQRRFYCITSEPFKPGERPQCVIVIPGGGSFGLDAYEPVPRPHGNDWLAVVEITKEHHGWRRQKCFCSVLKVESQREAYAKSMSLGQHTISVWP
jgi:hypothetical protein